MAWWHKVWRWIAPLPPEQPPELIGADAPEIIAVTAELSDVTREAAERSALEHKVLDERLARIEAMIALAQHKRIED